MSKTLVGNVGFCAPFRMIISLNALKYYGVRDWAGGGEKVGDRSVLLCLDRPSPIENIRVNTFTMKYKITPDYGQS